MERQSDPQSDKATTTGDYQAKRAERAERRHDVAYRSRRSLATGVTQVAKQLQDVAVLIKPHTQTLLQHCNGVIGVSETLKYKSQIVV